MANQDKSYSNWISMYLTEQERLEAETALACTSVNTSIPMKEGVYLVLPEGFVEELLVIDPELDSDR